jgi:hypothetical protein
MKGFTARQILKVKRMGLLENDEISESFIPDAIINPRVLRCREVFEMLVQGSSTLIYPWALYSKFELDYRDTIYVDNNLQGSATSQFLLIHVSRDKVMGEKLLKSKPTLPVLKV